LGSDLMAYGPANLDPLPLATSPIGKDRGHG
jgi:hypothetical protein